VLTVWVHERWALSGLEAAVFICSGVRLIAMLCDKQRAGVGLAPVLLAAVCLWGVVQLVLGWTVAPYDTTDAILYWLAAVCFAWLGQQACAKREDRRLFLKGALFVGSAIGLIGIVQLFTSDGRVFWLFPSGYDSSVIGPFVNPNHFACFVELLLPIALVLAFENGWYLIGVAGLLASVVASASRAGTILVIAETVLVFVLRGRSGMAPNRWVTLTVMASAFSCVVGYQLVLDRFFSDGDPLIVRREFLESSLAMVRAQPVHGFGLGAWPSAYRAFAVIDTGTAANHAHNEWIEWAAEGGLPVLAVMALVFGLCLPAAVRSVWGIGVIAAFIHSFVDYPFLRLGLAAWIFVFIGALRAYARDRCPPERANPTLPVAAWPNRIFASIAVPVLACGVLLTARFAWADGLYRGATAASVERASVLFPDNAEYHFALARLKPARAVSELQRCLAINPFLTNARIELAFDIEDRGDLKQAEAMLLEAARRDTQFAPAWALVNFYFRNNRPDAFWQWARKAANMSYDDLRPLFDLCFLVTADARVVEDRVVTPKHGVEILFLDYLLRHNRVPDADCVASRIASAPRTGDAEPLLNFIDRNVAAGRYEAARQVWDSMSKDHLLPYAVNTGWGPVNGDFSRPVSSRGFDWRLPAVEGITTAESRQPGPALEVEFSGKQPEICELLSQFVFLDRGKNYNLRFEYRTIDLPNQTGLTWTLGKNRVFELSGSRDWAAAEWPFRAAANVERLSLGYHRVPGTTRTEGALTLRQVRITER